ncbi:MAG: glycosyltransferase, partial [bacterium]|nr:glycosyltransferase [bacterium]
NNNNLGFGAAHNLVLDLLDSDYHFVINPDIIINNDIIMQLCDYLQNNTDTVMITPRILYENGDEQFLPKRKPKLKYLLGGRIPFLSKFRREYTLQDKHFSEPEDIDFCTGCFFAIRTNCFINLNGFDRRFFMYFEDADLTLRAKQFGRVVFYPYCNVTHLWERASTKSIKYLLIHIWSMFKFFIKYLNK